MHNGIQSIYNSENTRITLYFYRIQSVLEVLYFLIVFIFWVYYNQTNKNNLNLRTYMRFTFQIFKLKELSKDIPFFVLLRKDGLLRPEFHRFHEYVHHYDVHFENVSFGIFSPPKQLVSV